MNEKSLSALIAVYNRKHGPQLDEYLGYFTTLPSLEAAIHFACHGRDGKIHDHQHLVGKKRLERANKSLQKSAPEIAACQNFSDLISLVEKCTENIDGFGALAVYDTALRIGAHLGLSPDVVYLHAGTRKGCNALAIGVKGNSIARDKLPGPIKALEPYHAENFLCIFKGRFAGEGR